MKSPAKCLLPRYLALSCGLAAITGAIPAYAQQTPTPQTRPANPDRPAQLLNPVQVVQQISDIVLAMDLSDYQKAQIQVILDKAAEQAKALQDQSQNLTPREKARQLAPLIKDLRQQLGGILNPDQVRELLAKLNEARPDGRGGQASILNLRDAIAKLDLSTDQRQQVAAALLDLASDIQALREKAQNGDDVSGDVQKIRDQIKEKLTKILTPDQQQQLHDLMQQPSPTTQNANPSDTMRDAPMTPGKQASTAPSTAVKIDPKIKSLSALAGPAVGAAAPEVNLHSSDGNDVPLSSLKGQVVVIELGSLSCPSLRDHAAAMEKLKTEVGSSAVFMLVYTREADPAGDDQVERNRKAKIDLPQPTTLDARKDLAARAASTLHISFPITVDDMDDHLATTLGGFPNGCLIINKNGLITARQHWTDPSDLRRLIDEANK